MELWLHHAALSHPETALADDQSIPKHGADRIPHPAAFAIILNVIDHDVLHLARIVQDQHFGNTQVEVVQITISVAGLHEKAEWILQHLGQ